MKKLFWVSILSLSTACLMTGCIGLQFGGGSGRHEVKSATVGQQLVDLKAAKDSGAINEGEYQCQKNKILGR